VPNRAGAHTGDCTQGGGGARGQHEAGQLLEFRAQSSSRNGCEEVEQASGPSSMCLPEELGALRHPRDMRREAHVGIRLTAALTIASLACVAAACGAPALMPV
jgi:hypothetical protein